MGFFDRLRGTSDSDQQDGPHPTRALVGAGAPVRLGERSETSRAGKTVARATWQNEAWVYRDTIGELRYVMDWLGAVCSRVRLYCAVVVDPETDPVAIADAVMPREGDTEEERAPLVDDLPPALVAAAAEALHALSTGSGHGAILDPLAVNIEVAGECYLLGTYDETAGEQWAIRSMDELQEDEQGRWTLYERPATNGSRPTGGKVLDPDTSYVGRLWKPHPRWRALPDSPMRALLDPCEELLLQARAARAATRSRLNNGLLFVADELDFEDDGKEGEPTPFEDRLSRALVAPIGNEADPAAVVPIVIRGPAAVGDVKARDLIFKVDLGRSEEGEARQKVEQLLGRIAQGLDAPPEIMTGLKDVKYANAVAIDSASFRYHVEPLVTLMVDSLTVAYLRPRLEALAREEGPYYGQWTDDDVARLVIWYDPSEVVSNPNRGKDALTAHTANALSDDALRRYLGFGDDDAPSDEELLRRLGLNKGAVGDALTLALLRLLVGPAADLPVLPIEGEEAAPRQIDQAPADDDDEEEGQRPAAVASATDPLPLDVPATLTPSSWGERALHVDLTLRARVEAACDAAVARALERATARAVSRTRGDTAARALIAQTSGAGALADLGRDRAQTFGLTDDVLLAGAFDELAERFTDWTAAAQEDALRLAAEAVGVRYWTPAETAGLTSSGVGHADRYALTAASSDPARRILLGGIDFLSARARQAADLAAATRDLVGDLTRLAAARIYDPRPDAPAVGEHDPNMRVPAGTVRAALARAGGAASSTLTSGIDASGRPVDEADGDPGMVATGLTVREELALAGVPAYAYRWHWGGSPRPFEPHRALDGQVFSDRAAPVLFSEETWIASTTYFPGDHGGCRCSTEYLVPDPFAGLSATEARSARARQQARLADGRFAPRVDDPEDEPGGSTAPRRPSP